MRRIHQFEERHHPRMHQRVRRIHQFEERHHPRMHQRVRNSPTWRKASSKSRMHQGIIQECSNVGNSPISEISENGYCWRKYYHPGMPNGWRIYQNLMKLSRLCIIQEGTNGWTEFTNLKKGIKIEEHLKKDIVQASNSNKEQVLHSKEEKTKKGRNPRETKMRSKTERKTCNPGCTNGCDNSPIQGMIAENTHARMFTNSGVWVAEKK